MPKPYHTVRMSRAPQMGDTFHSLYLDPAPERDKFWKVMFAPVPVVSGGFAVTLQECAPPVTKGPVGEMVHDLLRSKPPEPTLGMIYAKVAAVHTYVKHLERRVNEILANVEAGGDVMRVQPLPSTGQALGAPHAYWPEWCTTFNERKAYQQGVADARNVAPVQILASAPDCRTCSRLYLCSNPLRMENLRLNGSDVCVSGDKYQQAPVRVLWDKA